MKTHLDEKRYQCSHCGKNPHNYNLECHMSTHSGEKPYQCSECNKIFTTKVDTYMPDENTLREKKLFKCSQDLML